MFSNSIFDLRSISKILDYLRACVTCDTEQCNVLKINCFARFSAAVFVRCYIIFQHAGSLQLGTRSRVGSKICRKLNIP